LCSVYWKMIGFCFLDMWMISHLSGLNDISHSSSHFSSLCRNHPHIQKTKTDHLPIYTTQPGTQVNKQSKIPTVGVTITNDLTWNHHINNITNKANASLRFIKRNVG
jgi:hypothetical protein